MSMYKVIVPVSYCMNNFNKEETVAALKKLNAKAAAFIVRRRIENGRIAVDYRMEELKEVMQYFESMGFETGVWVAETIGHGMLLGYSEVKECKYRRFEEVLEKPSDYAFCPSDESFTDDICEWLGNIVKAGAKFLLLDDDFRMSNHGHGRPGCICNEHIKEYCRLINKEMTKEEITEKVFTGGESVYRDTWIKLQGDTIRAFAEKIRKYINGIDDSVRIGLCCAHTIVDIDGTDNIELARILAGKNKPFVRLLGAPYWAKTHGELGNAILLERYMRSTVIDSDIETIGEGDTYPRPRFSCPASYLELFDLALRTDGHFSGILKFAVDEYSGVRHEPGYADAAEKNTEMFKKCEQMFAEGEFCGINVFEAKHLFKKFDFRGETVAENIGFADRFSSYYYPPALEFMNNVSLPVAFGERNGATLVFGESAKYIDLTLAKNGLILDMRAAMILKERGVDTGIISAEPAAGVEYEFYREYNEYVILSGGLFYDVKPNSEVKIITELIGKKNMCGAYLYENSKDERFMVYPFDADASRYSSLGFVKSAERQKQMISGAEWVQRKKLPAVCTGHPYLYLMCKKTADGMAVGVWNLSADKITQPVIELDAEYSEIEVLNGKGVLNGYKAILGDIAAFDFEGFAVKM